MGLRMRTGRWRGGGTRSWALLLPFLAFVAGAFFYYGWLMGIVKPARAADAPLLRVYRHDIDEVVHMDVEQYVRGVVAAEMPTTFHLEALKAQAVAARTYALQLVYEGRPLPDHPDAIISTNPAVHQAWISEEQLRQNWGHRFLSRWAKISRATKSTRGMVVVHDGMPIFPAYHSSSGGRTEDSERYWSGTIPYLRGVDDPFIAGTRYEETSVTVTMDQMARAFGGELAVVAGRPFVEVITRHPGGRVHWARVGDEIVSGREVREKLGLRSNWFEVDVNDEGFLFRVKGFGHGVGMSQYGADGMGRAGHSFDEILTHYYTGVDIVSWYD